MFYFYLDASAVIKHYLVETGSPLVNHFFSTVERERLIMLTQGIGETLSALVRRHNAGALSDAAYQQASQAVRDELMTSERVQLKSTGNDLVFASLPLIEKHNINATDALVLRSALDAAVALRAAKHDLALLAADGRLLRAAQTESLAILNPETDTVAQLDALVVC